MKEKLIEVLDKITSEGFYYLILIVFTSMPFIKMDSNFEKSKFENYSADRSSCNRIDNNCMDFLFVETAMNCQTEYTD